MVDEIGQAPWEDAGWLKGVESWIDGHVERTGMLEMVKKWSISVVLKVPALCVGAAGYAGVGGAVCRAYPQGRSGRRAAGMDVARRLWRDVAR